MKWFGLKQKTSLFWVKILHLQPGPPFSCTQSRCSRSRSTRCGCCNQNWETWRENDTFGKREQVFRNLVNLFSKTMTICMASILRGSISGKWNYYIHKDLIQQQRSATWQRRRGWGIWKLFLDFHRSHFGSDGPIVGWRGKQGERWRSTAKSTWCSWSTELIQLTSTKLVTSPYLEPEYIGLLWYCI